MKELKVNLTISLPLSLVKEIETITEQTNMSRSGVLNNIVKEYFENRMMIECPDCKAKYSKKLKKCPSCEVAEKESEPSAETKKE
jgi:metal-responsive CopG/Arc/MetJ family transcriptional regulator